jgi:hypothetical protein
VWLIQEFRGSIPSNADMDPCEVGFKHREREVVLWVLGLGGTGPWEVCSSFLAP